MAGKNKKSKRFRADRRLSCWQLLVHSPTVFWYNPRANTMLSPPKKLFPSPPLLLEPAIPFRQALPLRYQLPSYLYCSQSLLWNLRLSKGNPIELRFCANSKSEPEVVWEEPDDGLDSEYEEDEMEEEKEDENKWSEACVSGSSYQDDLMKGLAV